MVPHKKKNNSVERKENMRTGEEAVAETERLQHQCDTISDI